MQEYLKNLNEEQYKAATTIDGPLLILAGAGTGKTHTLISRLSYMIDSGIDPQSILLLTFTNRAANEMKNRAAKDIGEAAKQITASTFHSFCYANIICPYIHYVSPVMNANVQVIDTVEEKQICDNFQEELKKQMEKESKTEIEDFPSAKDILAVLETFINSAYPNGMKLDHVIEDYFSEKPRILQYRKEIKKLICQIQEYKKRLNVVSFNDIMMFSYMILENDVIRSKLSHRYKYIMVDEYQDTNIIQDRIVDALCSTHQNICVVGDDNQSIYRFRGANVQNILTFHERHANSKTIVLYQNYRSTQEILNVSNEMMKHATEGILKELKHDVHGPVPRFVITDNEYNESKNLCRYFKQLHANGVRYQDIAVLIRNGNQSIILENELNKEGIPFQKYGGKKFMEYKVVRDILAYLQVQENQGNVLAWERVFSQYRDIAGVRARKYSEIAAVRGLNAVAEAINPTHKVYSSYQELKTIMAPLKEFSLQDMIQYLLDTYLNYQKRLIKEGSKKKKEDNIRTLEDNIEIAKGLIDMSMGYRTVAEFVSDLFLENKAMQNEDNDTLTISTIHSAKGLEWDYVFLYNVDNSVYSKHANDPKEDAEDMRVLYVGLTRAKKMMTLLFLEQSMRVHEAAKISHHLAYSNILHALSHDGKPADESWLVRNNCY